MESKDGSTPQGSVGDKGGRFVTNLLNWYSTFTRKIERVIIEQRDYCIYSTIMFRQKATRRVLIWGGLKNEAIFRDR